MIRQNEYLSQVAFGYFKLSHCESPISSILCLGHVWMVELGNGLANLTLDVLTGHLYL